MKTAIASMLTALAASVCCIGPVVAATTGAGAIATAAVRFEPYRPLLVAFTVALLGLAFYRVYGADHCVTGSTCAPASQRRAKRMVWLAAAVVLLFLTFPYYIELFV